MDDNMIGPKDVLDILKRRKWWLIVPIAIGAIVAGAIAWRLPAIYKSTATIMIEQREIPSQYVLSSQTTYAEQRMQNIRQRTLTSKQLQTLIKQFDLYRGARAKLTVDEILAMMRSQISLKPISVKVAGKSGRATIAFTLSYEGKNPSKVQQVTDRLVTLFLKEDLKERTDQASSTQEFLQNEKDKLKVELITVEERLAEFKKTNANSLPELFQFNMQTLNSLEMTAKQARESLQALKEKKEELEEELANTPPYLEKAPETVSQLGEEKDESRLELLQMDLIALKTKYSDLYPDVKKLQKEIDELTLAVDRRKEDEVKAAEAARSENPKSFKNPAYMTLSVKITGLKSDIASVKLKIRDLEEQAKDYRSRLAVSPDVEAKYNEINTERTNLTSKYKEMQAKMMEAKVAHSLEAEQKGERFTLIESATLPEKPFKPNRRAILLVGFILAVGAGIGMAAIIEFLDDAIRTPRDVERISGFQVLTTVPNIITRQDRIKAVRLKMVWVGTSVATAVVFIFLFDAYVMDLSVLATKVLRKLS